MSQADLLRRENQRLREEIQHFQKVLREASNSQRGAATWRLNQSQKTALVSDIEMKLEKGVFSPPKGPRGGRRYESSGKRRKPAPAVRKPRASRTAADAIRKELSSDLTRIESSLDAIQTQHPDLRPALQQEIVALRQSLEALLVSRKRTMKDSFESYYNSERENLETRGRPELSFEQYQREHLKGERRLNRSLLDEIRKLQSENERLKSRLASTTRRNCSSRGRTVRLRETRSHSKLRSHCRSCDFLLSRGLSTTRCPRHTTDRESTLTKLSSAFSPQAFDRTEEV